MSEKIDQELKNFAEKVLAILNDNFVGFYIYGSYAMGEWHPERSDIDLMIITKKPIAEQEIENLKMLHESIVSSSIGSKIEGEYADLEMLQKKAFSNVCGKISDGNFSVGPSNLSADNLACLIQYGRTILGKDVSVLGLNVTKNELDEAVLTMLKEDRAKIDEASDFKTLSYLIINVLRCIYTLQTEKLPSKIAAVEYYKNLLGDGLYQQLKLPLEGKFFEFPIDKDKIKEIADYGLSLRK